MNNVGVTLSYYQPFKAHLGHVIDMEYFIKKAKIQESKKDY